MAWRKSSIPTWKARRSAAASARSVFMSARSQTMRPMFRAASVAMMVRSAQAAPGLLPCGALGSFIRATERLFSSQPGVSRQVSDLETDLGLALFDRDGPRIGLTLKP